MFLPLPLRCPPFPLPRVTIRYSGSRSSWLMPWQVQQKPPFALHCFRHRSRTRWVQQGLWPRESTGFFRSKVLHCPGWKFWKSLPPWRQIERSNSFPCRTLPVSGKDPVTWLPEIAMDVACWPEEKPSQRCRCPLRFFFPAQCFETVSCCSGEFQSDLDAFLCCWIILHHTAVKSVKISLGEVGFFVRFWGFGIF